MAITVILSVGSRASDSVTVSTVTSTTVSGYANAWSVVLSATVPSTTKVGDKLTTSARDYLITNIAGSTLTVAGNPFTTTTAPSTGSGAATTRAFPTPATWASGAPANLTTQGGGIGWLWKSEIYKEGTGTDNEWVIGSFYSGNFIAQFTSVTDTDSYFLMTAAPGQSFRDNPNKLTNALRYNPANGVAINNLSGYTGINGTSSKVIISNLQIKIDVNSNFYFYGGGACIVDSCILYNCVFVEAVNTTNCLMYGRSPAVKNQGAGIQHINTIFIGDGTGNFGNLGNPGLLVIDCAFFGFLNFVAQVDAFSTNNATDMASFGWIASGNIVSLTFANQFQNIGSGTEDFRVKAGAALINAGIRMQSDTNDLDIVGSARSITTPTIGAWEYASTPPPVTSTDYSSPLSRGIFRGIERGVA